MSKFGQYQLFDRIAIGGMAEIFRGRAAGEEGFEKQVAIKRILPSYARDGRFVSMLVTEARIHSALTHRNIVEIHDLGVSEDGEYFIVLEYVDGHDLGALLGRLAERRARGSTPAQLADAIALYIAIELGEGIHFAHELTGSDGQPLGLIHRDISPSNVLLSYAGEVKLSDFGLAKRRTDHSVLGSLKGKLAYMSPEQARRAPIDRRSDLFALGAVLYEMLTGHPLREIDDNVAGWQQVASGLIPPARRLRADLPPAIDRLLAKALEPDPRDRFADVRAFVNDARTALEDLPRSRLGEAGELQSLLRALLPPGTARPARPPSRVIRLLSEILSTDTVHALGSDLTVPGTDVPAGGEAGLGGSADEPSSITVVATPRAEAGATATPPPPPIAPTATLEWPRPGPPPLPPFAAPAPRPPQGPRTPPPPGAALAPGPVAPDGGGPRARNVATVDDPAPDEALRSVAGLIEIQGRSAGARAAPVGNDDRIIAAWPSLLPSTAAAAAGAGDDSLPAPVAEPGAGFRADGGTPPLGGTGAPTTPAPPPQMPPFPPAPSAPGPVRAPLDPAAPAPAGPAGFFPSTLASHVGPDSPHRTEDYAQGTVAPLAAPAQPIFYAPPPPPVRRPTGERTAVATSAGISVGRVVLLLALLLAGVAITAAVIHLAFVPLEVLAVWSEPAPLHVRTEPRGSEVYLDGHRLSARTPTYTEVHRDRQAHMLEVRQDGFAPETRQIRFDRTVKLEQSFALQRLPTPAIEPMTPPPVTPVAPVVTPAAPGPAPGAAAADSAHKPGKARGKARGKGKGGRKAKATGGSAGQRGPK